ncbi:MAG: hypothetical protein DRR04_06400 [Gammaproteobacteria bacterium]|nr:MAG: hypothetical protein DRQ97_07745 [Gammaproteobacteria bacterium]RLA60180.1 MAG: hypothetical protein DRR04_06400 [Gammaproteobacteria bacterium]
MTRKIPYLSDLYQLAAQLELDKEASIKALRTRDHRIGLACDAREDSTRLLYWLQQVSAQRPANEKSGDTWLSEAAVAYMARAIAIFFGFTAMMSLLLTSGKGLVNVLVFVLIFVVLQFVMSCFSAWAMFATVRGNTPIALPMNPVKLMFSRIYPDLRYFREAQSVLRITFLRYGQEMGALFTIGAMLGFLVVLALSEFTFVWGSTFQLSDDLAADVTNFMALPWSSMLPAATVDAQVIVDSRFHPALTELGQADIESMRGWWPFLFMSLACYALLPRVVLWLVSRFYFRRFIKAAFIAYPRSDLVLARMKSPIVETQGAVGGRHMTLGKSRGLSRRENTPPDGRFFLLSWAGALVADRVHEFEEFAAVPAENIVSVGAGPLAEDKEQAKKIADRGIDHLLVVVKSWEPPMADLADFLAQFSDVSRCTVYLLALPRRPVAEEKMEDWRNFSRSLQFAVVDVRALENI